VTKQKDFVTEMDFGWLMEVYAWETQCNGFSTFMRWWLTYTGLSWSLATR